MSVIEFLQFVTQGFCKIIGSEILVMKRGTLFLPLKAEDFSSLIFNDTSD